MNLKLLTDLIDSLDGLKAFINLPNAMREAMRKTQDDTYRRTDTTLSRVIIRVGNLLLDAADDDFLAKPRGWATSVCRQSRSSDFANGKGSAYD